MDAGCLPEQVHQGRHREEAGMVEQGGEWAEQEGDGASRRADQAQVGGRLDTKGAGAGPTKSNLLPGLDLLSQVSMDLCQIQRWQRSTLTHSGCWGQNSGRVVLRQISLNI